MSPNEQTTYIVIISHEFITYTLYHLFISNFFKAHIIAHLQAPCSTGASPVSRLPGPPASAPPPPARWRPPSRPAPGPGRSPPGPRGAALVVAMVVAMVVTMVVTMVVAMVMVDGGRWWLIMALNHG